MLKVLPTLHQHKGFNLLWRRRQWQPTPVLLPGKSYGWRSLVGCSPWGHWGSDTTEWLHFHFSLSCTGEGDGNSLQCSCLENPRDGRAWWVAVYGVAQSRTQLKHLSSSSIFHIYIYIYIYIYVCISPACQCLSVRIYKIQGLHWVLTSRFIELIVCVKMRNPRAHAGFPSLFVTLFLIYLQVLSQ